MNNQAAGTAVAGKKIIAIFVKLMRSIYKYLFALVVSAYMITVVGIPVYFHYCGGELEKIDYVMKTDNCCGDQDEEDDNGCCSDEGKFLVNSPDFTIKDSQHLKTVKSVSQWFSIPGPINITLKTSPVFSNHLSKQHPPPLSLKVVSVTVLRI